MKIRTYSELIQLHTFEERFRYLKLSGKVGVETFGFDRYLNQQFYKSDEWLSLRDDIIIRDLGCDLAVDDREIHSHILVHHMNPITKYDVLHKTDLLLNPEYLVCTAKRTHNAIHYGDESILFDGPIERTKNDTCPWRR
jgi:hypothetical protein